MHRRKLCKVGNSYNLNLPQEYIDALAWKEGDDLLLTILLGKTRTVFITKHGQAAPGPDTRQDPHSPEHPEIL